MTYFYEIRLAGHLDAHWADWFDGMSITLEEDGNTLLSGPVPDQPALYGILRRVRDLGLPLVSVNQITVTLSQQILNKKRSNTKMNTNNMTTEMEDIKVSLKLKLAAMWTSFMFLYTYVDHFHLYMPGKIEDILAGKVFTFDISYVFLMVAMFFVAIPVLMIFLSVALPAKVNRWTNIIVAAVYIPYMLFNLVGEAWLHMYFAAVIEVILLCLIIRYAWKWPLIETRN
ncbi:DUF6326 family protein [Candidatus Villigracilis proximus]|uniref:DUF6326 family protein n=1 Tax=Candidatus Villigracilis proximus TaxID=3140683 RepID=UPI0031E58C92